MMNIYKLIIILPLLVISLHSSAQKGPGRERIKTLKVAFLTERLDLSRTEAQQFWPIYNENEEVMEAIRREERSQIRERDFDINSLSDEEASALLTEFLKIKKRKEFAEQKFLTQMRSVISDKKIILLIKAEEDFKRRLLQQMRNRRN